MSDHRSTAAVNLLSQMLLGVSMASEINGTREILSEDQPDFSMDEFITEDTKVSAKLFLPTGDVYEVSVAWNAEESP